MKALQEIGFGKSISVAVLRHRVSHYRLSDWFYRRYRSMIYCLLASILFAQSLPAQTSDWDAVISVPAGTVVIVRVAQGTVHCTLASVTESDLTCYRERQLGPGSSYRLPRSEILQVKREEMSGTKRAAVIAMGVAAGAAIGAAVDTRSTQKQAVGACVGALGGTLVGLMAGVTIRNHGVLVYQR